jgi:ferredoxin
VPDRRGLRATSLGPTSAACASGIRDWGFGVKVRIDPDICTGHGRCYTLAPQVFDSDDRGYGVVIDVELSTTLREVAEIGIENCPEQAIFLEE